MRTLFLAHGIDRSLDEDVDLVCRTGAVECSGNNHDVTFFLVTVARAAPSLASPAVCIHHASRRTVVNAAQRAACRRLFGQLAIFIALFCATRRRRNKAVIPPYPTFCSLFVFGIHHHHHRGGVLTDCITGDIRGMRTLHLLRDVRHQAGRITVPSPRLPDHGRARGAALYRVEAQWECGGVGGGGR